MNVLSGKIPENKCISSGKFLYFYYTTKIIFCQIKSRPGKFPAPANSKRNGVGYVPNKNEIAGWKKLEKDKMKLRLYIT